MGLFASVREATKRVDGICVGFDPFMGTICCEGTNEDSISRPQAMEMHTLLTGIDCALAHLRTYRDCLADVRLVVDRICAKSDHTTVGQHVLGVAELMTHIASFLDVRDRRQLALVSRTMCEIVRHSVTGLWLGWGAPEPARKTIGGRLIANDGPARFHASFSAERQAFAVFSKLYYIHLHVPWSSSAFNTRCLVQFVQRQLVSLPNMTVQLAISAETTDTTIAALIDLACSEHVPLRRVLNFEFHGRTASGIVRIVTMFLRHGSMTANEQLLAVFPTPIKALDWTAALVPLATCTLAPDFGATFTVRLELADGPVPQRIETFVQGPFCVPMLLLQEPRKRKTDGDGELP